MSVENVKKFYTALSQDEALQKEFVELAKKYQGQPMDETKAMSLMEQEVLPVAKQKGYSFSIADVNAYGEEMKHADLNRELSDLELQAVTGGGTYTGFCILAGVITHTWDKGQYTSFTAAFCMGPGQPL